MKNINLIPQFEIGKRAYISIITICIALIIIAICTLAVYTIYLTSSRYANTENASLSGINTSKERVYNISALLAPDALRKQGVSEKIIQQKQLNCYNYIKKYKPVAEQEMKKYGIPTWITLAQGLLESDAGNSKLAKENNNHFGIKCFSKKCKKGHCANFTDDSHKDFFRNYDAVWNSYRDHSLFLMKDRYKHLLNLDPDDYEGWAYGLQKAGYATDKRYGEKLVNIIKALH
ncbi:glucosaminidase domain-containing protein [bacterium]|nr:glucosaminidase domain-containing protein [bacterium]